MNGDLLAILESIEREKGIDREILIAAIESAIATPTAPARPPRLPRRPAW